MIRKNFKGRCRKWKLEKCKNVMRAYSDIQEVYAEQLAVDDSVKEIRCNVMMTGLEEGEYTSEFVCVKTDDDLMIRECVERRHLMKPKTVRLLEASRRYWMRHGVKDWGLVIDAEK